MAKRIETKTIIGFDGKERVEVISRKSNFNPFKSVGVSNEVELPIGFTMLFLSQGVLGKVNSELKKSIAEGNKQESLKVLETLVGKTKFRKMKEEFSNLFPSNDLGEENAV